jgi:CheY-like chemotaxis protein
MIEHAVEAVKPGTQAKHITMNAHLDEPGASVWGDPDRLHQVVANLLANAVRFTPDGGQVEIFLTREGEIAVIRVEDDGPGIDPELMPHVFDRYRRGDPTPAHRHGGLGLGLSIVRHLVELHGGSVSASNRPDGRGARFEVRLQLSGTRSGKPLSAPEAEPAPSGRFLHGLRILVVDDDPDSRDVLELMLIGRGAVVEMAGSCAEAMVLFEARCPDLIISDIGLPDGDGYELIRRVRSRPVDRGGAVAAIALTAYAGTEDVRRAIRCGYQVHVAKPFDATELIRIVQSLTRPTPIRA